MCHSWAFSCVIAESPRTVKKKRCLPSLALRLPGCLSKMPHGAAADMSLLCCLCGPMAGLAGAEQQFRKSLE